jgi:hypothetical protein
LPRAEPLGIADACRSRNAIDPNSADHNGSHEGTASNLVDTDDGAGPAQDRAISRPQRPGRG